MNKNEKIFFIGVVAILIVAVIFLQKQPPTAPSGPSTPTPTPPAWWENPPAYPTPPPSAPETDERIPTSLYIVVEPNPSDMNEWVYGSVTSDGYNYPITVHAKHVGANEEASFGARLSSDGQFYHSQTMDTPGYWDFWATADGVTSNTPRLRVNGAVLTSSRTFFSRMMGDMDTTLKLYCHSAGSTQIFANKPSEGTSTPMETVYINSGGYATTTFDFSGWSLGNYELDFVVNGIKASDYGESVFITLGR